MAKLIRTDRNGTKYYVEQRCPRCGGSGYVYGYEHVDGGRCFLCGGSGIHEHTWKERTPEYEAKLAERRAERMRKKAPEINAQFLEREGFSEDGKTWVVLGDTYTIREELKKAGAKYSHLLGWHFPFEVDGYDTVLVGVEQLTTVNWDGCLQYDDAVVKLADILEAHKPKSESEYIGEVGERIAVECVYNGFGHYSTNYYSYYGEDHYVYRFTDDDGNKVVWNTGSFKEFEEGKRYTVSGIVKEHKEYKEEKQTCLSRCKIQIAF